MQRKNTDPEKITYQLGGQKDFGQRPEAERSQEEPEIGRKDRPHQEEEEESEDTEEETEE